MPLILILLEQKAENKPILMKTSKIKQKEVKKGTP